MPDRDVDGGDLCRGASLIAGFDSDGTAQTEYERRGGRLVDIAVAAWRVCSSEVENLTESRPHSRGDVARRRCFRGGLRPAGFPTRAANLAQRNTPQLFGALPNRRPHFSTEAVGGSATVKATEKVDCQLVPRRARWYDIDRCPRATLNSLNIARLATQ